MRLAKKLGVSLHQRYAHAHQFKRANRSLRKLKTYLGRVIGEKHIVAVVLGGTSNAARDARMRQLIEDHISLASTQRTVPIMVERNGQRIADGEWVLYLAAQRLKDDGWRHQSPAGIARFYGDFGWKSTDAEVHLVGGLGSQTFPPGPRAGRASMPF